MKPFLKSLLEGRSERDQHILIGGTVIVLMLLLWLLIWQPLLTASSSAESKLEQRRKAYVWMQEAASQINSARGSGAQRGNSGVSPQQQITGAASALGININRIEPQSTGRYSVWVASTEYNSAVRFIESLTVNGMQLHSVNMSLLDLPGMVSLRVSVGEGS
jgi:general secretion pathway protein M